MEFTIASFTGKGGRTVNEDSIFVKQEGDLCLAIVADGLGMHGGGEIASTLVIDVLSRYLLEHPTMNSNNIYDSFSAANQALLLKQTAVCKMKSTAALLFSMDKKLAFAHVGDSRIYHFVNGAIRYQTLDHSVSQMAVAAGEITPSQIRFHEDRNRLLRAIGGESIRPEIIILDRPVSESDAFLLCSDGFWEYLNESEMELDLMKSQSPQQWLSFMLERVARRIDSNNDNLSAITIFYKD